MNGLHNGSKQIILVSLLKQVDPKFTFSVFFLNQCFFMI